MSRQRETVGAGLDDGDVGVRIVADQLCAKNVAVRHGHLEAGRAAGHMAIGHYITVGRDGEARAGAVLAPAATAFALDADVHYRGADARDCSAYSVRIGIEKLDVRAAWRIGQRSRRRAGRVEHCPGSRRADAVEWSHVN